MSNKMTNKKETIIIEIKDEEWENVIWSHLPNATPSDDETREAFKIKPNKKEVGDD